MAASDDYTKTYIGREGRMYTCKICQQVFTCFGNVEAHIHSRHYSPGYSCVKCCRVFKSRKTLIYSHGRNGNSQSLLN